MRQRDKPSDACGEVLKILLVLSHGLVIHKGLTVDNQKEKSLVAQRLIVDHVRSVWGITKAEVTKEPWLLAAGGRHCCCLDEEMRKKEHKAVNLKRVALRDELDDLKKKRPRMEADICALEKLTYE